MGTAAYLAIAIFIISYGAIISEKISRTISAMIGGSLMIFSGVISQHTALEHIDFNVIGLLIGMMIIVSVTEETGLFRYVAIGLGKRVKGRPLPLLIIFAAMTAVGSAFLDNVTTVMLMVPVTFSMSRQLKIDPMPFLITEILMANIGGTATMIGDPPNIMIGSAAGSIDFIDFIVHLAPISLLVGTAVMLFILILYRKKLHTSDQARDHLMAMDEKNEITDKITMIKAVSILALTIFGFFIHPLIHAESATVALAGAFLLLVLTGEKTLEHTLSSVEWPTIFFFLGLFVLVGGLIETGIMNHLAQSAIDLTAGNLTAASFLVLWLSAMASAFMDNIPFVATMIPLIEDMGRMGIGSLDPLWWSLALGACLGGNGSLIGASANLIVAGLAAKEGRLISFTRYLLVGFPVMLVSVTMAMGYIYVRYLM
ncbi:ArsB/NhaD family transporter [Sporolactobacillus sp. KGMB 08714]|uniref:ArsB/NhaD family transporter n=1 Tax=Sporolactobacillus sp. KGMB 08714 TaxID=3064704 RepID=UPI002FBDD2BA